MQLAFNADMMFVLNNTDAPLYMRSGSNSAPSASYFDLYFPPVSYTVLDPQGGWDYAGFLDNPSSDDCWVIFVYGYADEYRRTKELLGIWDWYLPNFDFSLYPSSMYEFFFDFTPANNFSHLFDFTIDQQGFSLLNPARGFYSPGVGWVSSNGGVPGGNDFITIVRAGWSPRNITNVTMYWQGDQDGGVLVTSASQFSIIRLAGVSVASQAIAQSPVVDSDLYTVNFPLVVGVADSIQVNVSGLPVINTTNQIIYALLVEGDGSDPF